MSTRGITTVAICTVAVAALLQVGGWAVLLTADCPDDAACTGTQGTVSHAAGLAIYASFALPFAAGLGVLAWLALRAVRCLAGRLAH